MSSSPVMKVVVKAANGSMGDFRVDASHQWRIQDLKKHLYRHYPTHPPLASQKLIYGGKLLLDQQTIKEIVPEPGDDPVIIHLVAYERSASAPSVMTPNSASRQPSVPTVEEAPETDSDGAQQLSETERQQPAAVPVAAGSPPTLNPWLRYRISPHGQRFPAAPHAVQNFPAFVPGTMPAYPFPQFYMSPYNAAYATQMAQWYYNYYGRLPPGGGSGGGVEGDREEGGGGDILDLPNPQDLPNEQDLDQEVAVNAGGVGMMAAGNFQPLPRRDLVDYVYMFVMALFLVSMAYITGSVGRLLIFIGGLLFMLLNQGGWFSVHRRRQAHQPRVERVDPNQQPPPQEEGEQEEEGEEEEGEEEEGEGEQEREQQPPNDLEENSDDAEAIDGGLPEQGSAPPPQPEAAPPRPGLLATIFVFVTSFFTSLIPRQQLEL